MKALASILAFAVSAAAADAPIGAPDAPKLPGASPLTPEQQRQSFSLPPGFEMELVASEPDIEKVVAINFDHAGRLWAITATEYPIDGNEQPEEAKQLYARGGKDRALVFDNITGTSLKPRVFADGLAIPLGILPLSSNTTIIAQGPDIFTLTDTDNDGKGDKKEILLTGFGIQDSHLMPHGFMRGPGDWIYFAQGAFNYSQVKTKEGTTVQFDQCKVGRFKLDGSQFEIVGWGLNNIWGFVIDRHGQMFAQEANDLGYPMVPFHVGVNYPGIGMHKARPYAPWHPPLANHFQMGGTGLSGLALAEGQGMFTGAYNGQFYLANPITGKIQAIEAKPDGSFLKLTKLPDFALTQDSWFRPVAMQFGPDGCLYIVDWYNKIISHNEVPRTHPERDKSRSRIWRVKQTAAAHKFPNIERATPEQLLAHLKSDVVWPGNAAWQRIVDTKADQLAPELRALTHDKSARVDARLRALWALEGLKQIQADLLRPLLGDSDHHIRREAVRVIQSARWLPATTVELLTPLTGEPHPHVRFEIARTLAKTSTEARVARLVLQFLQPPLDGPTVNAQQGGGPILTGAAADRAFERYLLRVALEKHTTALPNLLAAADLNVEGKALAAVTLGTPEGAAVLASVVPALNRSVSEEECILLASHVASPAPREALKRLLEHPEQQQLVVDRLWTARDRIDLKPLQELIRPALASYNRQGADPARVAELAGAFQVEELRPAVEKLLATSRNDNERIRFTRALAQFPASDPAVHFATARSSRSSTVQLEAVNVLAKQKTPEIGKLLIQLWPDLALLARHKAAEALGNSPAFAKAFLDAIDERAINADEVDSYAIEKITAAIPADPRVAKLRSALAGAVETARFSGAGADQVPTGQSFSGPFTLEAWARLQDGINNQDAIVGSGDWDLNFHDGRLRLYAGPETGDAIIASKPVAPNTWTHFALTRSTEGQLKLYVNGALSATGAKPLNRDLPAIVVGQSMAVGGFGGEITELRIWNTERSADEILSTANLTFAKANRPAKLVFVFPGDKASLGGATRIDKSADVPTLLTEGQAAELETKFQRFRQLASGKGSTEKGREVFTQACATCHSVQGQGGQIGPALNGAGAMGTEALLRSIITPNAMMESGYRRFQVERADGETVEGFLVSDNGSELRLRPLAGEDVRIAADQVKRASFSRMSLMPEGLLESLSPEQVSDLFAYLQTLK
ncbi:MAG TPA: PVC-type heme-binding CxxCH protein [Methylomirabilota bacterium]|nr:PVC-type heme-binding CxxCH protein [Methylomirabilota bacterium]